MSSEQFEIQVHRKLEAMVSFKSASLFDRLPVSSLGH